MYQPLPASVKENERINTESQHDASVRCVLDDASCHLLSSICLRVLLRNFDCHLAKHTDYGLRIFTLKR